MIRLDAPGKKVKILLAVSVLCLLVNPAYAQIGQDPGSQSVNGVSATEAASNSADDVSIKTLAPLAKQTDAASNNSASDNRMPPNPGLTFIADQDDSKDNGKTADPAPLLTPQAPLSSSDSIKFENVTPLPAPQVSKNDGVADGTSKDTTSDKTADAQGGEQAPSASSDDASQAEKTPAIAQNTEIKANRNRLLPTTIIGTVELHKKFKLFTREELIHNLSFRDALLREVIAELARRGNLNIILDKSVTGKITGELRDVTLNEAMENVLAAAGLETRDLDGNTVLIATQTAITELGLSRPMARAFKLSYASPFEVAQLLHASVFNKGLLPNLQFTQHRSAKERSAGDNTSGGSETVNTALRAPGEGGGTRDLSSNQKKGTTEAGTQSDEMNTDTDLGIRLEAARSVRGSTRQSTQEGTGFNSAATDPGSMQIRSYQEVNFDYPVEQNGGGAIVIPDSRNRQVIVVGTKEDIAIADQAIRFIDKRPKEVHIQVSVIELDNQGIRQLGASLNVQGNGLSGSIMGNNGNPLVQFLPGLGSPGNLINPGVSNLSTTATSTGFPPAQVFTQSSTYSSATANAASTPVPVPAPGFSGLIGALIPAVAPTIAGVAASSAAQSAFNFLTLSKAAGGRANIATLPAALGVNLNLALQTNKAKVIANPSVVVVDNTEALITIATEVIHKVTSTVSLGVVSTNVELTKAGIFLDVLPKITEDGFITMRLRPTVSSPTTQQTFANDTVVVTPLSYRDILSQQLRVRDGQTLVIGGLFTEQEAADIAKVPYLAEAPILGALFRNTLKGRNRTELIMLLTPKIVEEEPPTVSDSDTSKQM
jgi:type II secretory pathway component GspD/PulD (secretin)